MRRSAPVTPFLIADHSAITAEPWRIGDALLDSRIPHWDPELDLGLERSLTLDIDTLLRSTGIDRPDDIGIAVTWRSDRTRLRGSGPTIRLGGNDRSVNVAAEIPGRSSGGTVKLETLVVRLTEDATVAPLVARRAGSVLWRDMVTVALEGGASRFPVSVVDFGTVRGADPSAAWALEWNPHDLDQPVLGAMRLLINRDHAVAVAAVSGEQTPRGAAVRSMIGFDVARSLVHGALTNEDFVNTNGDAFDADTVGRVLHDLLESNWPGVDPETLRRRLADTPHRIDSELQAVTGLLAP